MTGVKSNGYFHVSRKTFLPPEEGGDVLWHERREFSRWEAWMNLIQLASHSGRQWILTTGAVIQLQRGETPPLALSYLAKKWGWGLKKVRNFIELLSGERMERVRTAQRTPDGHTYLLVNYEGYQSAGHGEGTHGARTGHGEGTHGAQKEEGRRKVEEREEGRTNPSCPEPAAPASGRSEHAPVDPVVMDFPVIANGEAPWTLRGSKLAEYADTFPHLEVGPELRRARQWLIDNPAKRKTPRGMPRFLFAWLERRQNRGAAGGSAARPVPVRNQTTDSRDLDDLRRKVTRFNPEAPDA